MKKNELLPVRILVAMAMLSALSIVLGKYLAINAGEFLRFSFENLPIIFAGAVFGPIGGIVVGVTADLIGCLLVGYAINPLVTLGAAIIGLFSGTVFAGLSNTKAPLILKIVLATAGAHIIGSVIVKSIGLAAFYSQPLPVVMLMRLGNYAIIAALEIIILYPLLKSQAVRKTVGALITHGKKIRKNKTMTYEEALEYIHGINWTFCKPGLERTEELCKRLGNPEASLKFIHVAGTNGKGSFSSMLAGVLQNSGLRVGLYTSPYIIRFNERMKVNGEDITDTELAKITAEVKPIADSMADRPTEFELITAIAFTYFARHGCDVVVLEAGMGGRLDSTNVIRKPLLSVITGIALDHTAFLGDTTEKIAKEKAGIIKDKAPVLYGGADRAALEVIRRAAEDAGSDFYTVCREDITVEESTLSGTRFSYKDYRDIELSLLGTYQPYNAANVLSAVDILRERGLVIPDEAVRAALKSSKWPARFEIISDNPLTVYDGAHNPEGIESAVKSIKHYFKDERVYAVSGVLKDKDYRRIAKEISTVAEKVFTLTPDNPRALSAEEYANVYRECGIEAEPYKSIKDAVKAAKYEARGSGKALVCLGSLYIYSEVRDAIEQEN